ncbi:MAG: hypothetical protein RLN60_03555 [Phycisphaerales bacterium]
MTDEKSIDQISKFNIPEQSAVVKVDVTPDLVSLLGLTQGHTTIASKPFALGATYWKSENGNRLIKSDSIDMTVYQVEGNHCRCTFSSLWTEVDHHSHIKDYRGYRLTFIVKDTRNNPLFEWVTAELGDIACRDVRRPLPNDGGVESSPIFRFPFDDVSGVWGKLNGKFVQCHL